MNICRQCNVTGRVQGVFFRASTQRKALSLGITGYAKNLSDGSVEVLACGEHAAVEQLQEWLWQGPDYARVEKVSCADIEHAIPSDFTAA